MGATCLAPIVGSTPDLGHSLANMAPTPYCGGTSWFRLVLQTDCADEANKESRKPAAPGARFLFQRFVWNAYSGVVRKLPQTRASIFRQSVQTFREREHRSVKMRPLRGRTLCTRLPPERLVGTHARLRLAREVAPNRAFVHEAPLSTASGFRPRSKPPPFPSVARAQQFFPEPHSTFERCTRTTNFLPPLETVLVPQEMLTALAASRKALGPFGIPKRSTASRLFRGTTRRLANSPTPLRTARSLSRLLFRGPSESQSCSPDCPHSVSAAHCGPPEAAFGVSAHRAPLFPVTSVHQACFPPTNARRRGPFVPSPLILDEQLLNPAAQRACFERVPRANAPNWVAHIGAPETPKRCSTTMVQLEPFRLSKLRPPIFPPSVEEHFPCPSTSFDPPNRAKAPSLSA